jgi:hypothetical protein
MFKRRVRVSKPAHPEEGLRTPKLPGVLSRYSGGGTDWPHSNMDKNIPDDGKLIEVIPHIAVSEELQRKPLVGNPMPLYWPDET